MTKEYAEDVILEEAIRARTALESSRIENCDVIIDGILILDTMYVKILTAIYLAQANLSKVRLENRVVRDMK